MKVTVDGALEHVKSELEDKKSANEEYLENEEGKDSPNAERTEKYGNRISALEAAIGALEDVDLSGYEKAAQREIEWWKRTLPKEVAGLLELLNDVVSDLKDAVDDEEPCEACDGAGKKALAKDAGEIVEETCEDCNGTGTKKLSEDERQTVEDAADKVDEVASELGNYE